MKIERRGMLMVLSGPSGAGKGTLAARLLADDPSFGFSVSATTRAPRPGEIDGVHYHFISEERYDGLLAEDAFLEHAEVHGHRYGTLKSEVEKRISAGMSVLLDIDVQGALNVMAKVPDAVSVFILPPGMAELRKRLEGRQTETPEAVERRMRNAAGEIARMDSYRYIIVNDDLETAARQLEAIAAAEKQRATRFRPQMDT